MDKMPNETDLRTQIDHLMVEFLTIIPATEIFLLDTYRLVELI